MTKRFKLRDLDCASCAAKMEDAISKLDGVEECTISFMTQRLILTAPEERFEALLSGSRSASPRSTATASWKNDQGTEIRPAADSYCRLVS